MSNQHNRLSALPTEFTPAQLERLHQLLITDISKGGRTREQFKEDVNLGRKLLEYCTIARRFQRVA